MVFYIYIYIYILINKLSLKYKKVPKIIFDKLKYSESVLNLLGKTEIIQKTSYQDIVSYYSAEINNWTGLQIAKLNSIPTTFNDYLSRSKNWLNGRRTSKFFNGFFPELIIYAMNVYTYIYISMNTYIIKYLYIKL